MTMTCESAILAGRCFWAMQHWSTRITSSVSQMATIVTLSDLTGACRTEPAHAQHCGACRDEMSLPSRMFGRTSQCRYGAQVLAPARNLPALAFQRWLPQR